MSACPWSYGISVNEPFSEIRHRDQDRFVDPLTNIPMAKGRLTWFIKKGDLVLSDGPQSTVVKPFSINFTETCIRKVEIPIYAHFDDHPPKWVSGSQGELTVVHTLEYDLTDVPLEEAPHPQLRDGDSPYYTATLNLTARLDRQFLGVELCWRDETLCSVDMDCLCSGPVTTVMTCPVGEYRQNKTARSEWGL
ncbi:MAG: hypothetical protein M1839_003499 [Geoglossum umbratile]|nr:MAG: hypothetical protein M1839_003499 [Geoglossum umbratile]